MEIKEPEFERVREYILGKTLGSGSVGTVKLAIHADTGDIRAIKILTKKLLDDNQELSRKTQREIAILRLIQHPHVLRLFDVLEGSTHIFLVLEYVEGGELFDYIRARGKLQDYEAHRIFEQIVSGLRYCHCQMICHRDLKLENVLLDKHNNVKIADFGMASLTQRGALLKTSCGSPHYAPPEIVQGLQYDGPSADVWSLGVVLYACLVGRLPFDGDAMKDVLDKVKEGAFTVPPFVCEQAKDLMQRMLTVNPADRIPLDHVLDHPWCKRFSPALASLPEPFGEPSDATLPVDQVDTPQGREILKHLRSLGWLDESSLIASLKSPAASQSKVLFRRLMERHRGQQAVIYSVQDKSPLDAADPSLDTNIKHRLQHLEMVGQRAAWQKQSAGTAEDDVEWAQSNQIEGMLHLINARHDLLSDTTPHPNPYSLGHVGKYASPMSLTPRASSPTLGLPYPAPMTSHSAGSRGFWPIRFGKQSSHVGEMFGRHSVERHGKRRHSVHGVDAMGSAPVTPAHSPAGSSKGASPLASSSKPIAVGQGRDKDKDRGRSNTSAPSSPSTGGVPGPGPALGGSMNSSGSSYGTKTDSSGFLGSPYAPCTPTGTSAGTAPARTSNDERPPRPRASLYMESAERHSTELHINPRAKGGSYVSRRPSLEATPSRLGVGHTNGTIAETSPRHNRRMSLGSPPGSPARPTSKRSFIRKFMQVIGMNK